MQGISLTTEHAAGPTSCISSSSCLLWTQVKSYTAQHGRWHFEQPSEMLGDMKKYRDFNFSWAALTWKINLPFSSLLRAPRGPPLSGTPLPRDPLCVFLAHLRSDSGWDHASLCVLVFSGCCNKVPQTGQLKQQKFIVSQFWKLKVWDQGVSRVVFNWGLSPWLVDGHLLPVSSHGPSFVHTHVCVQSPSYKDTILN